MPLPNNCTECDAPTFVVCASCGVYICKKCALSEDGFLLCSDCYNDRDEKDLDPEG